MDIIQPQQQNKPAEQGTGFTNLSQYIGANQNNQLGNVVGGGVQQAGQAASGAINQAGQQFQQAAGTEQSRLSGLGQNVSNTLSNLGNVSQSNVNDFQSALSGKGQGPTGLSNANDLTQKANNAQAQGAATGSEMGRFGLLQNYVGKNQQYGLGQQTLDSAILGQTGQKQLGQARAATANLGGQANQAIAAASAQGQQLQNQAQQLASNAKGQLGKSVVNYDTSMGAKLAADQAQQANALKAISGVGGNSALNLDQNTLNQLSAASGGVLNAGTNLYNVDLSPYVTANTTYANKQGVQDQSDFAKVQALSQLAGTNGLAGTSQQSLLNSYLSSPGQVGQFAANSPFSVSSNSALSDALKNAGSQYNGQLDQFNTQLYNTEHSGMGGDGVGAQLGRQQIVDAISKYSNPAPVNQVGGMTAPESTNSSSGYLGNLADAQAALANNQAYQQQINGNIGTLGQTFDINRILGVTPPAVQRTPVLGNDGQPLTT